MATVLFFRSNKDFAMMYASNWLGVGVQEAVKRGYKVIDLVDEACIFDMLKATIESEKPDIAIMGGHGNATVFSGFEQQIVLQACTNDEVMSGTISHFLSCSVGQILLPSIVEKKGISTIGYQVDFRFDVDLRETPLPGDKSIVIGVTTYYYNEETDKFAEPFKDVTVTIIRKILEGAPLKDVWDAGIAKCNEWIQMLWGRPETDWAEVISDLQHDRDGMIALGDKEAYVLPPTKLVLNVPQLLGLGLIAWILLAK